MLVQKINLFRPQIQYNSNIDHTNKTYYQNNNNKLGMLKADTVTFSGNPFIDTRSSLTKLLKYKIPCPCCGEIMFDAKVLQQLEKMGLLNKPSGEVVKTLTMFENYMHPVERKIFRKISRHVETNPEATLQEVLIGRKPAAEKNLIKVQTKIFDDIRYITRDLDDDTSHKIRTLLAKHEGFIFSKNPDITFGRKKFINELEELLKKSDYDKINEYIMYQASKLPSSTDDINAFIVKYSKYPSSSIARRLLSGSIGTIEHIHPKTRGGVSDLRNYMLECASDNSGRSSVPMPEQIAEKPYMIQNVQKYIDKMIELANAGKIDKAYIIDVKKALYKESKGLLDLDISSLRGLKHLKNGTYTIVNPIKQKIAELSQKDWNVIITENDVDYISVSKIKKNSKKPESKSNVPVKHFRYHNKPKNLQ